MTIVYCYLTPKRKERQIGEKSEVCCANHVYLKLRTKLKCKDVAESCCSRRLHEGPISEQWNSWPHLARNCLCEIQMVADELLNSSWRGKNSLRP